MDLQRPNIGNHPAALVKLFILVRRPFHRHLLDHGEARSREVDLDEVCRRASVAQGTPLSLVKDFRSAFDSRLLLFLECGGHSDAKVTGGPAAGTTRAVSLSSATTCRRVCPRRWAALKLLGREAVENTPQWTWQELTESFSILSLLLGDKYNLALFVDGLDEFDGAHQKLLEFIRLIHSRPGTKVCVSSRPWNVFSDAFACNPNLRMEDLAEKDIAAFVKGQLQDTPAFKEFEYAMPVQARRLTTSIAEKAKGVFLWVSVVVILIRQDLRDGDSIHDLQAVLDALPSDLSSLYQSIWTGISPRYIGHSSRLFQIHHCSTALLDVVTLWLADEEDALEQDINTLRWKNRREHIIQTMTRRLNSRTRGLLEISNDGVVDYLHRTVRDWIVLIWSDICAMSPPQFDPHLALTKALTVEVSSSAHWATASASIPTQFWGRVSTCFYHAARVPDAEYNIAPLVQILDKLDQDLEAVAIKYFPQFLFRSFPSSSTWTAYPHWSTSQYTKTTGSPDNTFLGLAAQFTVTPYVRRKVEENPTVLRHSSSSLSVLSCVVLGLDHFSRPDIVDCCITRDYLKVKSFDARLDLVRFLLSKGALAVPSKQRELFPREQATWGEVQKHVQRYQNPRDEEKAEASYWAEVDRLFGEYMEREEQVVGKKESRLSPLRKFFKR